MDALHWDLWRKIREFQIDRPGDALTFTDRLARENGWPAEFARRVVEEYRRFIFLAVAAGHEVTPSEQVDEAWHLHLMYTQNYWNDLCRNLLGRPIHHVPSRGGSAEAARFQKQYRQTLASYRRLFEAEPPADIWPQCETSERKKSRHTQVDLAEAWVIAKPWAKLKRLARPARSSVTLCVVPTMLAVANPLDLKGPEFLWFYACLVGVAVVAATVLRHMLRGGEDASKQQLTPYQVACLAGGIPGVVQAAIVSLVDRQAIQIVRSKSTGIGAKEYRLRNRHGLEASVDEIEHRILAASNTPEGCYLNSALRAAEPAAEKIHFRLQAWGLMTQSDRLNACQLVPFIVMLAVVLLGTAKIVVGISRGKPVEFLLVMVFATIAIACVFLFGPLRTQAGDAVLERIREQVQPQLQPTANGKTKASGEHLILAAALLGLPAIAAGELAPMPEAWKHRAGPPANGGGGGCGSSGCGGGGGGCGGGGCGGGGCGGCGS